jgi:hypothetical protein
MTEILAREFTALGHHVTVVTRTITAADDSATFPFAVVRAPSCFQLLRLMRGCDVFVHNHLSLKVAFPLLLYRRPWVVVYHCLYSTSGLQRFSSRFAFIRDLHMYRAIERQCVQLSSGGHLGEFRYAGLAHFDR